MRIKGFFIRIRPGGAGNTRGMSDKLPFITRTYEVRSAKIKEPVRFVFVTDFHEKVFDPGNERLIRQIRKEEPDAVLIGGDMIVSARADTDSDAWLSASRHLLSALSCDYPVFAAQGNHEAALADEVKGIPAC